MNHPNYRLRRLLLFVPLALLGAAWLVRSRLPLPIAVAEAAPTASASNQVTVAVTATLKPPTRATTPKRKPQAPVSAPTRLRQQAEKTAYLVVSVPIQDSHVRSFFPRLSTSEEMEISNRTSIRALLRTLQVSRTSQPASDPLGDPSTITMIANLSLSYQANRWATSQEIAILYNKGHCYLRRYHNISKTATLVFVPLDTFTVDPRSMTQFFRRLREAVDKGRHKQRGYFVHILEQQ